ncbi:hypothetical protein [Methanoregula sp.]|uniref:hypothetical protein n=1 Tax=Methanoregula sp. TaxID=2052170 RepID=UPI000CC1365F|nr:hypothetical protein [Methanoregula sp.]PKG33998.1 MAG: hypothetical protein CW742_00085 [Methanoregula sp.]
MRKLSFSVVIVLMSVGIVLCAVMAGCTNTPPAQPATGQKLSTIEPAKMALQPSDLPVNYTLVEEFERNATDMREWSLGMGWKKGYGISFETRGPDARGIDQLISVYPVENITLIVPDTVSSFKNWTVEDGNVTIEDLPSPGIGDASSAMKVTISGEPVDTYIIAFVKYDVYEELYVNGTASDYDVLKAVAGKAAAKIT